MPQPTAPPEAAPDPERRAAPDGWLALLDPPRPGPLPPLLLGLLRAEVTGRARTLCAALALPDPDGLSGRLLGQPGGVPSLHAAHLLDLTATLPPATRAAFYTALNVTPLPGDQDAALRPPRLDATRAPVLRWKPRAEAPGMASVAQGAGAQNAGQLARALRSLGTGSAAPLGAALTAQWLGAAAYHWLDQPPRLFPLDFLAGLGGPDQPAYPLYATARQQALTTLGEPRRTLLRTLLNETRTQHAALRAHEHAQDDVRRAALRACLRVARDLIRAGWLDRPAQARFLTPTELRDAADGLLDPAELRALAALRRDRAAPVHENLAAPEPSEAAPTALPALWSGTPLAPGVRKGPAHHWTPGQTVPEGAVLIAAAPGGAPLTLTQWPQVRRASALILGAATPNARVAAQAREDALAAVALPDLPPGWLQDGDLVRVNGHQGSVTLLRRAGDHPEPAPGVPERPTLPSLDIVF